MLQPVASTVPVTVATGLMSAAVMLMPSRMNPVALQVVVALVCVPKSIAKASEVAHPKSNRLILPPSNCQLPNFQVHRNLSIDRFRAENADAESRSRTTQSRLNFP